jgi:CMP-N-acetylneuraminic acid synthetase
MKQIVAVIPVRKGSERVPNKNIRPFANKTLLEYKIDIIKQLPIDDIIINTDCPYAIEVAKRENLKLHFREPYYASSKCTGSEFHHYLAKVTNADNLMIAHVTGPMVSIESFKESIEIFESNDYDSIMSVEIIKKFLWFEGKSVNYNSEFAPTSQDLPEYLSPTFGISLINRAVALKRRHLIGYKPFFYKLSEIEAVDIDSELDFEFAEFLFKKFRLKEND